METKLADVIVPEVFNQYVIQKTAELSAIRSSGIAAPVPGVAVPNGGYTVNMPYWNDLTGEDEVLSESDELTPGKIAASKDVAVVLARGRAWGVNDLAIAFSGANPDPMRAIGDLVSAYWARKEQATLLAILKGIFASASMSDHLLDVSGEGGNGAIITAEILIDALSLLGDAGGALTGIITHSAVMYDLAKKNILDAKVTARNSLDAPELNTYLGRRLICDDSAPVTDGVYTTYLFGQGAIGYAEGSLPVPTETERKALAGNEYLVNRRSFILHPRGVKWNSASVDGATPSNAELATAANWTRVYEGKNVRIVALKHKIGPFVADSGGSSQE
ncbi:MAG: major capsid protein [Treponema sp.]|jgi:hypothetical protein|nr:major capsid protein [Treponema sp.]